MPQRTLAAYGWVFRNRPAPPPTHLSGLQLKKNCFAVPLEQHKEQRFPLKGLIIERFTTATGTPSRKFQLPMLASSCCGMKPSVTVCVGATPRTYPFVTKISLFTASVHFLRLQDSNLLFSNCRRASTFFLNVINQHNPFPVSLQHCPPPPLQFSWRPGRPCPPALSRTVARALKRCRTRAQRLTTSLRTHDPRQKG